MREGKIEAKLTDYCRKKGVLCYKFSSPSKAGVPDRILVGPKGEVIFLELKATGAKPTALQSRELERLSRQGAIATWTDNFATCKEIVDRMIRHPRTVAEFEFPPTERHKNYTTFI